jgi:hypothetical protein
VQLQLAVQVQQVQILTAAVVAEQVLQVMEILHQVLVAVAVVLAAAVVEVVVVVHQVAQEYFTFFTRR